MDALKKLLAVLVVILLVVLGAGLYLSTKNTVHGTDTGMDMTPKTNQPKVNQKVNVVLEPDLTRYIDEINKGINLINEANGLITSDSFFSNPPKVPQGKTDTTPYDKLVPKDGNDIPESRSNPILVYPDGTYQVLGDSGLDMRDVHRGIYKLGQGMTVLNSVLDKMNQDIKNNNFPYAGTGNPVMPTIPGMSNTTNIPGTTNMPAGYSMTGSVTGTSLLGSFFGQGSLTNVIYLVIIGFMILAIFSIIGFVLSLFKGPKTGPEPH